MKKMKQACLALAAASAVALVLVGCPTQPSYPSRITPIYAATTTGLWVYNGTSWTDYTTASGLPSNNTTSVIVSGSGSGAEVFVGTSGSGIWAFDGSASATWGTSDGLGSNTINRLLLGQTIFAATAGGLSVFNTDGSTPTWTNDTGGGAFTTVNDVFSLGSYTYIAADSNLYVANGSALKPPVAAATILIGSAHVQAVFVDPYGDIFAGTDQGLGFLQAGASPVAANWASVLPVATSVKQICTDANGNVYIATSGGLYVIGASGYATLVSSAPTNSVCVDGAGTIYAGTSSGLQVSRNGGSTWTTELAQPVNSVVTTAPLYSF